MTMQYKSVFYLNHFFAMKGTSVHQAYDVNMCLYLPDKRLVSWSGRDMNGIYTWYNSSYKPKVMLYTINLTAAATPTQMLPKRPVDTTMLRLIGNHRSINCPPKICPKISTSIKLKTE